MTSMVYTYSMDCWGPKNQLPRSVPILPAGAAFKRKTRRGGDRTELPHVSHVASSCCLAFRDLRDFLMPDCFAAVFKIVHARTLWMDIRPPPIRDGNRGKCSLYWRSDDARYFFRACRALSLRRTSRVFFVFFQRSGSSL